MRRSSRSRPAKGKLLNEKSAHEIKGLRVPNVSPPPRYDGVCEIRGICVKPRALMQLGFPDAKF